MNRILLLGLAGLAGICRLTAATIPIFINDSALNAPPDTLPTINATSFVNRSSFNISTVFTVVPGSSLLGLGSAQPYETANTLFFTNSGSMVGSPGFRFMNNRVSQRVRRSASWFVNEGSIDTGSYLEIRATNIINTGPISSSAQGLIRIVGGDVNLSRSGLRNGNAAGTTFGGGQNYSGINRYSSAPGVSDAYWAVGTNNSLAGNTAPMALDGPTPNFNLPTPSSPLHQVQQLFGRTFYTNQNQLPKFHFSYDAFVHTNTYYGTAAMVQVVFVPSQAADTNITTTVSFSQFPQNPSDVIVEFTSTSFDIALDAPVTTSFFLVDHMATSNNAVLFRPLTGQTRRPSTYEFLRSQPFQLFNATPGNSVFTNGLLGSAGFESNAVTMRYAAYSADVSVAGLSNASTIFGSTVTSFATSTGVSSPTNLPGRVEVFSDKLDLELTRIRSESTIVLKTKDLSSNQVARVDAPFLSFDLASKQPEMVISNLAPSDVNRVYGPVCAWSGLWRNVKINTNATPATTNETWFHVLFVDHSLQTTVPVQVYEFAAHATNLVVSDQLNVTRSILLDAKSMDVRGGINFPFSSSWGTTNVRQLVNFTNRGVINVPGSARYGTDRPAAYSNFVNFGTNIAGAQFVRTRNFENSGSIGANNGLFTLDAATATMKGPLVALLTNEVTQFFFLNGVLVSNTFTQIITNSPGAKLSSVADLQISAGNLVMSNAVLLAGTVSPGRLIFSVTNSLVGSGLDAPNAWSCTSGFEMRRRPAISDLLSTSLRTSAAKSRQVFHTWSGEDRGTNLNGFTNNLALGRLTIDAADNSSLRFDSVNGFQALYVDYVELLNGATNLTTGPNNPFRINPRLTIYFANANVDIPKLDGAAGGRFRWVPSFAGPLSSTNITYPSGNTYTFNVALVSSKNIDSDGDECVNADDPTPIPVAGENTIDCPVFAGRAFRPVAGATTAIPSALATSGASVSASGDSSDTRLQVGYEGGAQPRVRLSWPAVAASENIVEYANDWNLKWEVLRSVVTGEAPGPVTVYDPIPRDARMRLYRLRIAPVSTR